MNLYQVTRATLLLLALIIVATVIQLSDGLPTKTGSEIPNCDGSESESELVFDRREAHYNQEKNKHHNSNNVRLVRDTSNNNKKKNKQQKGESTNFKKECLLAHNKWRRQHGANDLKLDPKVSYLFD